MRKANGQRGFSLIEVSMSMAMMTIVMGGAFTILNRFQSNYRYEEAYADAQRNARFAVSRLNEIIRTAGTNPTGDMLVNNWRFVEFGSAGVFPTGTGTLNQGDSIHLRSDLNGDKQSNATVSSNSDVIVTSEDVTVRLDAANRRIIMVDNTPAGNGTIPIADSISSLTFRDPDGSRRYVEIQLTAIPAGISSGDPRYREVRYTTTVRLRNRR